MSKYQDNLDKNRVKAQKKIIRFMLDYFEDNSIPPTKNDIAKHLGVTYNAANNRIDQLIEDSFVVKLFNIPRSLTVTDEGVLFLES